MKAKNPSAGIIKLIWPYLSLVVILSLVLSLLDALSMFVFSDALNKAFSQSSEDSVVVMSIINISEFSVSELFFLYICLFVIIVLLNWIITYAANFIGVLLYKKIHYSIMNNELNLFYKESISHYQVLLFEEVRNLQERFFVALSVVIHRSIFVAISIFILLNIFGDEHSVDNFDFSSFIIVMLFLLIFIFTIYKITRKLGELSLEANKKRYQTTTHGLWQWRWSRVRGWQNELVLSVSKTGSLIAKFQSTITTIGISFKNILEILIFILILLNYDSLNQSHETNSSVFIFGGVLLFRLMPAMSGILNNLVGVSSSISSFRFVSNALTGFSQNDNGINATIRKFKFDKNYSFEVKNLCYRIGKKYLFKDYSLNIPKFGVVVISGKSGSGKSTLLNILLGFIKPESGCAIYNGIQISRSSRQGLWADVGLVEQDYNNIFGTVGDVVSESIPLTDEHRKILKNIFKLRNDAHFQEFIRQPIQSLSGGERQRIAFLRVYFLSPKILILDEYGSGLDEDTLSIFIDLCKEYAHNNLVIWVSHIDSIKQSADKLINLNKIKV